MRSKTTKPGETGGRSSTTKYPQENAPLGNDDRNREILQKIACLGNFSCLGDTVPANLEADARLVRTGHKSLAETSTLVKNSC